MKGLGLAVLLAAAAPLLFGQQNNVFEQGKAAMSRGDYEKAADLFEKVVEASPKNAQYHFWLGNAYGSMAQNANMLRQGYLASKTKDEFEKAVSLDPNLIEARDGLVEFYTLAPGFMGGNFDKAKQQAAEIKKRDPFIGHSVYAKIYQREKKPELARKEFLDAVREQPSNPKAHYWLGVYYFTADKNYKAANDEFEATLRLDGTYMPALFQIGHVAALSATNFPRGEEALKRYLAHSPKEDDPPLHRAHFWLGAIYEKQGKKAEARANYAASLKMKPQQKDAAEALKRVS